MSLSNHVYLACLWEATISKPGNVHPDAAFEDLCYDDFVRSAECLAPVLGNPTDQPVGQLILHAAQATQKAVGKNTNLGIILVLTPLVVSARNYCSVAEVLQKLNVQDAVDAYKAIRLLEPGGVGKVDEHDVTQIPTISLLEAMHHARDRDLLAKAYCTRYHDVFEVLLPFFEAKYHWFSRIWNNPLFFRAVLYRAVQATFLHGIATLGETLIRRKCGTDIESEAQSRAKEILDAGWPETRAGLALYIQYDAWLRSDGHRRNPGTMADLMAAVLFLALEKGVIPSQPP